MTEEQYAIEYNAPTFPEARIFFVKATSQWEALEELFKIEPKASVLRSFKEIRLIKINQN